MAEFSWHGVVGPALRPAGHPQVAVIFPELVIGEYPNPSDAGWLRSTHAITSVVCLQDDADLAGKRLDPGVLRHAYAAHDIRFHHTPVPDGDLRAFAARLDGIVRLLGDLVSSGERVYLHCSAGMNRAPTVAIAYLHTHRGFALREARDLVKQLRPCVPYMQMLEAHYVGRPS